MKTGLRNFLMGAGLTVVLWAPFLKAEDCLAVAKIPFDFQVNQAALPAGTYTVIMDSSKSEPKLSFHHYGDHYFLSAIYADGNLGYTLNKGSLEREMERGGATVAMAYAPVEIR